MVPSSYCHRKSYSVVNDFIASRFLPALRFLFRSASFSQLRFHASRFRHPHLQNRTGLTLSLLFSQWPASLDQALDLLVSASCICYHTSTADLSTSSSLRGLTNLRCGSLLLQGGFTLRCLQRLSRPGLATLPWSWHSNRYTSGPSIPVLSY